ncbi:MAG: terminase family protein [Candidatus Pacearchaeota archaeon]|jgi:hypothetical protein|nr:terminase family protein [Clostridia bacterium]
MKVYTTQIIEKIYEDYYAGRQSKISDICYNKMTGYRKAGIMFSFSPQELLEYSKCATDPIYFIEKYCTASTINGIQHILLRDYQKDIVKKYIDYRFNVVMNSRQTGLSTIMDFLMLHTALFNVNRNIVLASVKECMSVESMDKIRRIYADLPYYLKPGVESYNKKSLKFDNGCRIFAISSRPTSTIGFSIHHLFLQDFAHMQPVASSEFIRNTYVSISAIKDSTIFIQSTPNGYNQFYDIYDRASRGLNSYMATKVLWWQVPGRDEKWKEQEIRNLGSAELFAQEYDCMFFGNPEEWIKWQNSTISDWYLK